MVSVELIESTLRDKCGLCEECIRLYIPNNSNNNNNRNNNRNDIQKTTLTADKTTTTPLKLTTCTLCLGLLSKNTIIFEQQLMVQLKEKIHPYAKGNSNGISFNSISKDSPTIVLPNIILIIAHCIDCALESVFQEKLEGSSNDDESITTSRGGNIDDDNGSTNTSDNTSPTQYKYTPRKALVIYNQMKETIRAKVRYLIIKLNNEYNNQQNQNQMMDVKKEQKQQQQDEEAGFLKFHLIFTPPLLFPHLPFVSTSISSSSSSNSNTTVRSKNSVLYLPPLSTKRERKRFRGSDPVAKQGGDPRKNLHSLVKIELSSTMNTYPQESSAADTNTSMSTNTADITDTTANTTDMITDSETKADKKKQEEIQAIKNNIVKGNIHCCLLEKNAIVKHIDTIGSRIEMKKQLSQWILNEVSKLRNETTFTKQSTAATSTTTTGTSTSTNSAGRDDQKVNNIGIFVSCWRNHFYLKGKYTKSRRDISQTPFYVNNDDDDDKSRNRGDDDKNCNNDKNNNERKDDNHKRMKRLGISSVEEEICPIICDLACNGISKENNEVVSKVKMSGMSHCEKKNNDTSNSNGSGHLVYGMCKFHASGREDMDVRMILPLEAKDEISNGDDDDDDKKKQHIGSGRPFVCEVIDAYKIPTENNLREVVQKINHNDDGSSSSSSKCTKSSLLKEITLSGEGEWVNEGARTHIQYGLNPNGVGISGLTFCPSSSFSGLQSETEDKVKFYGCLCWSSGVIPSQAYLEENLIGCGTDGSIYPLRIEQSTPLRVLHRRSAGLRIRHVLSLKAKRIDEHWFRLHLSTSAGTYVKEFCHGDCGRTKPSVSSLLGSKIDIVELDCEGIAI